MSKGLLPTIALEHPFGLISRPPSGAPPHTVSWERCAVAAVRGGRWDSKAGFCLARPWPGGDSFFVLKNESKKSPVIVDSGPYTHPLSDQHTFLPVGRGEPQHVKFAVSLKGEKQSCMEGCSPWPGTCCRLGGVWLLQAVLAWPLPVGRGLPLLPASLVEVF